MKITSRHTAALALLLVIAITTVVTTATSSCARNNGDIGPIFGTWKLTNVEIRSYVDDTPGDVVGGESYDSVFWSFQSHIIKMERLLPYHRIDRRWGTWSADDTSLTLQFDHHDDNVPTPGTGSYGILPGIYLPKNQTVVTLQKALLEYNDMSLYYIDHEAERIYIYYFEKW